VELILIKSITEKPWRSLETYRLFEEALKIKWRVNSISAKNPETLYSFIASVKRNSNDDIFIFNIAEFLDEKSKTGFLPALLEDWKIPHLGSSSETIAIGLDKARTKKLLNDNQIPTPRFFVANREDTDICDQAEKIGYPLIVKPIREGGHIGIREDSIIYDDARLEMIVNRIFDSHNQPALVEEFITGEGMREFSVGILDGKSRLFTPIEIDYVSMDVNEEILSYESAQKDLERTKLVQDEIIIDEIIDLSIKTFTTVGAQDYSRVDLRMNKSGCYVLEINIMPGLGPNSFLPEAAKEIHNIDYPLLIHRLVEDSMQRQKGEFINITKQVT